MKIKYSFKFVEIDDTSKKRDTKYLALRLEYIMASTSPQLATELAKKGAINQILRSVKHKNDEKMIP